MTDEHRWLVTTSFKLGCLSAKSFPVKNDKLRAPFSKSYSLSYLPARFTTPQAHCVALPHTKWGQTYEHYLHDRAHTAPSPPASLEVPIPVYILNIKQCLMQLWIHSVIINSETIKHLLGTSVLVTYLISLAFSTQTYFAPFSFLLTLSPLNPPSNSTMIHD